MFRTWGWAAGLGLFAALSAADFAQTYALVGHGGAHEVNPVAAEWLARHGWAGLAVFKGLTTLVVVGCVGLLSRRGSPAAGRVLALGCGALLVVGVYSRGLLTAPPPADDWPPPAGRVVEVLPGDPRWATPKRVAPAAGEAVAEF